ncbi:CLUMA_CG010838, isoform A [Clunio marinus]|uniref:CLUMA_CG010838, isoform A n=1 Tax=Clunio marinus TaxID=568069 RepID=A0A1J1IG74_9DIPT|nr:CLUMA_CG010838, isoform A [Clunio marinus]
MCDSENCDSKGKINDTFKFDQDVDLEKDVKHKMTNSSASILNDDTPTQDSGVQLLDSETDLNDSMISSSGFDIENIPNEAVKATNVEQVTVVDSIPDLLIPITTKTSLSKSDFENNNGNEMVNPDITSSTMDSDMMSSIHSTFDTEITEIVYRRKVNKKKKSAPKKRVSFHEDILNSTRTDNIHIEHGFITYKGKSQKPNTRYSWSEYNNEELDVYDQTEATCHHVYRNACSEVLHYGKIEIQDDEEKSTALKDHSGVFEYPSLNEKKFYQCSCSSSSSIESGSSGENNQSSSDSNSDMKRHYKQSKSSSCDCIGSNTNNIDLGNGTYFFSEPNIGRSVWSKEKKPKGSCLKKSKQTNVVEERKIDPNVKKFNIHQGTNIIKNNSKMFIGSLKDILGISLPERGVPEGSEDNPEECIPNEVSKDFSYLNKVGIVKPNPTKVQKLSKSLDGGFGKQQKRFVHNVDEQLRRANEEDLFAPSSSNSRKNSLKTESSIEEKEAEEDLTISCGNARNKFIINCESTVFEHTGTIEIPETISAGENLISHSINSITHNPLKKKLSNLLNSIAGNNQKSELDVAGNDDDDDDGVGGIRIVEEVRSEAEGEEEIEKCRKLMESSIISTSSDINSSIISDESSITATTSTNVNQIYETNKSSDGNMKKKSKTKHLSSPMRKKRQHRMSPDLFNRDFLHQQPNQKNVNNILSDDFDDILAVTTEPVVDSNDIVIVDYSDVKQEMENENNANNFYLKLPSIMTSSTSSTSSKTSLINRFLRNVTQKKILEASIKRNKFFQAKLKNEEKLFSGNLYVKGVKPKDDSLIKNLNDEIEMEIEMGCNSLDYEEDKKLLDYRHSIYSNDTLTFFNGGIEDGIGIGEVKTDLINVRGLQLFRDSNETLMKAFKLFTGYSNEGIICAVLVLLTDKTIYIVELLRNKLSNKFVLPYAELDVILMGPMGNTVLLSNGARDMQQVLLACGPYPAEKLVSSLEMCARRGGLNLPAVGELTLDHFAPLRAFVCNNSSVGKTDTWKYYSIVNIPAGILGMEEEPLGPSLQGFFMHRNLSHAGQIQKWSAGYFMLKAGVLYLFNDSTEKIPSWAVSLPNECQGARRCVTSTRPHCFEILLRTGSIQLAAPDEYIASDWLQSVIQAASGFFEMEERQRTLGCTLIMTENHLITLREDFSSPLRRVVPQQSQMLPITSPLSTSASKENFDPNLSRKLSSSTILDTTSEVSSIRSTPSSTSGCRSITMMCSTPTRQTRKPNFDESLTSHTNMTSFYGKNSGIEVLTCAAIEELTSIKISASENSWWCLLEFSCQEVRENFDDLVLFFSTNSELQRFLQTLEGLWHSKMNEAFPIGIATEKDCPQHEHCEKLFLELSHAWDPLLEAALRIKH